MRNSNIEGKEQKHAAEENGKKRKIKKYDLDEILQGMENYSKEDIIDWGEPRGREVW